MTSTTPQPVLEILNKLDDDDKAVVVAYIDDLQSKINGGSYVPRAEPEEDAMEEDLGPKEPPFPPLYDSGEDSDKAGDLKQEAADLSSSGNWEGALEKYTAAVLAAPPSALLYANRANTLLKLNRPHAAERDCNEALKENPDSAKALRIRGKARKAMGKWEDALHDLSASQQIDFDEATVDDLKQLTEIRIEHEKSEASERNQEENRLRKKAADIKKAQEEAKREAAEEASRAMPGGMGGMPGGMGGMPGGMGGMPGGMGGMPGGMEGMMGAFMSDPELLAAMEKPKVKAAFEELMSGPGGPMGLMANPAKLQEMMGDPDVGPVLQKLMGKVMGGGFGGGPPGNDDNDGIPNMDDGNVDLDDLPDLE